MNLIVAPVSSKGQVTLPKSVRSLLRLKPGEMVAFRIERSGRVEIVPVEVKEKKADPFTAEEWSKIDRLARQRGKTFDSPQAAKRFLKRL